MLYNLDEITLIPASRTNIKSRKECNTRYENKLPIFISPMSCLINETNIDKFEDFNIIIPRTVPWETRLRYLKEERWVAVGLEEAELLLKLTNIKFIPHICIDQANGHMDKLLTLCATLKHTFTKNGIKIMTGNIANPNTYIKYCDAGIDYVRVSVGTGNACTTSCQTGFHYPMASLLIKINEIRQKMRTQPLPLLHEMLTNYIWTETRVIADGGMKSNAQIIKALALGADYVMIGEIIAKSEEACGRKSKLFNEQTGDVTYTREYYGMSTELAQALVNLASGIPEKNKQPIKRAEGISKQVPIEYPIASWVEWFESDLRSAMSYNSSFNLITFIGQVEWDIISQSSFNKFMEKTWK